MVLNNIRKNLSRDFKRAITMPYRAYAAFIWRPLSKIRHSVFSRRGFYKACHKFSDINYYCSQDTSLAMVLSTSLAVFASHCSHIAGLKKSKRENKDYLLKQEKAEFMTDLALTIIPPFLIDRYFKIKVDAGECTTREIRRRMECDILLKYGKGRKDVYNTEHIKSLKELGRLFIEVIQNKIRLFKLKMLGAKNIEKAIKFPNVKMYSTSLEKFAMDLDWQNKFGKAKYFDEFNFYNNSAYSDMINQTNGLKVLPTLVYTAVMSSIVVPICKNLIANNMYKKELELIGETPQSVRRKARYGNLKDMGGANSNPLFNSFTPVFTASSIKNHQTQNDIFSEFNNISKDKSGMLYKTVPYVQKTGNLSI